MFAGLYRGLTTDIKGVGTTTTTISGKDISRQGRAYQIAQMRNIVHVWQSAGDEEIALPGFGEDGFILFRHVSSRSEDVNVSMVSGLRCPQGSQGGTGVGRNSCAGKKISTFNIQKSFAPQRQVTHGIYSRNPSMADSARFLCALQMISLSHTPKSGSMLAF